jgi:hypothetical protein
MVSLVTAGAINAERYSFTSGESWAMSSGAEFLSKLTIMEELSLPSVKVINRLSPAARKSPTLESIIVPSKSWGPVFKSETACTPGEADIERLIAEPSSIGAFWFPPMNKRSDRIRFVVLGPRDAFIVRLAAPPSLTTPSILAEQEESAKKMEKNNKYGFLKVVIIS